MKPEQIKKLSKRYLEEYLEKGEEYIVDAIESRKQGDDARANAFDDVYVDMAQECEADLRDNRLEGVQKDTDEFLKENGVEIDKKDEAYSKICREILKAKLEGILVLMKRWDGDYSDQFSGEGGRNSNKEQGEERIKLQEAIMRFVSEHEVSAWAPRTGAQIKSCMEDFLRVVGDRVVYDLDKTAVREYKEKLLKRPSGKGEKGSTLSPSTVNKYLSHLVSFFGWAKNQGYLSGDNPASGLKVSSSKKAEEERDYFSDEDLSAIFSGGYSRATKKNAEGKADARYFIPLILLLYPVSRMWTKEGRKLRDAFC